MSKGHQDTHERRQFTTEIQGAAQKHGKMTDSDHEVDDLQRVITHLFMEVLTSEQIEEIRSGNNTITNLINDYDNVF